MNVNHFGRAVPVRTPYTVENHLTRYHRARVTREELNSSMSYSLGVHCTRSFETRIERARRSIYKLPITCTGVSESFNEERHVTVLTRATTSRTPNGFTT